MSSRPYPHPAPSSVARHAVLLVAICASLAASPPAAGQPVSLLAQAAEARPASSRPGATPALPPQGVYEGCAPGADVGACVERLARIRAAGFRYVLDYSAWYGSAAEVLRYTDAAAALGLKLIWPLNHPAWRGLASLTATYPRMAAARTDMPAAEFTARAIGLVADHPATWGFYIGDELPPEEASRVGALSALVRGLAPDKPLLYVARPGAARLAPFAPLADVAGVDAYPVGSGDPPVRRAARSARSVASAADARTAMVLQAFSWSQYRANDVPPLYPSARRLRAMRDTAIRYADPAMILWYSFQDILASDRPGMRWRALIRAAFAPLGATSVDAPSPRGRNPR
jgi:hypothetical protein